MALSHAAQGPSEPLCPIRADVLAFLHRADEMTVRTAVSALPDEDRCSLAMFCAGRRELRALGLMVAALCDEAALIATAGLSGAILWAESQCRSPAQRRVPRISDH
jgi:hypothetical protein